MFNKKKHKVFCIGCGKTGTTSIEQALSDLGYKMGDQPTGELLIHEYYNRNFKKILDFTKTADAFQDAPFSFKYTFMHLDHYYPNAKFILSIRDSSEEWYNSLINFHSKVHTEKKVIPTVKDLKNSNYRYKGYPWDVRVKAYGFTEDENPYDKKKFIAYYESHNETVLDYFKGKKNLLVINIKEKESYKKLCDFIGKTPLYENFPWENKTSEIKK